MFFFSYVSLLLLCPSGLHVLNYQLGCIKLVRNGIVVSSFTNSDVVPNQYDNLSSVEFKTKFQRLFMLLYIVKS